MAKAKTQHVCQECGHTEPKWSGKCPACDAWNSMSEEKAPSGKVSSPHGLAGRDLEIVALSGKTDSIERIPVGISEMDRVFGGGLVPGSALLVAGDPGIGKSTLLLQAMAELTGRGTSCLYVSGEESIDQIRLRAQRLGIGEAEVMLAAATDAADIGGVMSGPQAPGVVVVDSIQTMALDEMGSAPGSVSQIKAAAGAIIAAAKQSNAVVLFVGHVTKDNQIAGPKTLEHMVDGVFYFEGERGHAYRILRSVKNRFGATDEIGVFEMQEVGLVEVLNPSEMFLAERAEDVAGSVVFAGIEGTRPLLIEIQALVSDSPFAAPTRTVVGWDRSRLMMILAVLSARCGIDVAKHDVYLNVSGGMKITEPAADLAVAAAIVSALTDEPLPHDTVVFGEVGLGGEIRPVGHNDKRLKEACKLGFSKAYAPSGRKGKKAGRSAPKHLVGITKLQDLLLRLDVPIKAA